MKSYFARLESNYRSGYGRSEVNIPEGTIIRVNESDEPWGKYFIGFYDQKNDRLRRVAVSVSLLEELGYFDDRTIDQNKDVTSTLRSLNSKRR